MLTIILFIPINSISYNIMPKTTSKLEKKFTSIFSNMNQAPSITDLKKKRQPPSPHFHLLFIIQLNYCHITYITVLVILFHFNILYIVKFYVESSIFISTIICLIIFYPFFSYFCLPNLILHTVKDFPF